MKLSFVKPVVTGIIAVAVFLALMLALDVLLPARAFAGTSIDQTVAVPANADVHVSNVSGSVEATAWNRKEVHIGGTLGTGSLRLAVEKTATGVDIRVVLPENSHHVEGSRLVIRLPAASRLEAHTVSADVSASGLTGALDVETVSGNVTLRSRSGDISVKTVSGDIALAGSAAGARIGVQTVSGELTLSGINGELQAGSVSGDVSLRGTNTLTRAQLSTTSGDLHFAAALAGDGNYQFHSVSGDVTLDFPAIPDASFNVSSFSGDIEPAFGPPPQRTSEYGPGEDWNYRSGQGNAQVNVDTLSGDVRLRVSHS
ncbi:MAG TPA: DUF4097 family beta strand repeat-containing protein [Gammaproteobacteria bacterium]|nr:DUF4097 family beta strand repeat-containing protein [Gammaproteobacteria bacterium]